MSFFNINYFNTETQFQRLNETPVPVTYSNIKLFGGGYFDDLHGVDFIMTDEQIDTLDFNESPEWDLNTIILAKFNNNLQAGNVTGLPSPITSWLVQRKSENDTKYTQLAEIEADVDSYIDRLAKSNETYDYRLLPIASDLIGEPLKAEPVSTDFNKVILLDPDSEEGYSFCLDLRLSEIGISEDIGLNSTRGKFDTYQKGNREVHSGSVGTLLNSNSITEEEMQQDKEFLDAFEAFLLNGGEKIIKFNKGYTYRIVTSNVSLTKKTGSTNRDRSLYVVSFSWTEIGEVISNG